MKRKNNNLKEASFLLIVSLFLASSVIVSASTFVDNDDIWRYVLINNQPVEAPETAQSPYAPVSAYQENENYGFWELYVYESFWDVTDEISKVVWWGMADNFDDGFIPGTPEGMNFKIEFYDDDSTWWNSPQTDHIYSFDVSDEDLIIIHTGRLYRQTFELIKFEYELPSTVSVSNGNGWISIWSYNDSEQDVFLWPRATEGDDFFYHKGSDQPDMDWDVAFQLYKIELDEPPETPTITGKSGGSAGTEYNYIFVSTDPEGDNITYLVDWGDNTGEVSIGPYISGVEASANHTWSEKGDYTIKIKARDVLGAESDWAIHEIEIPKTKITNTPFLNFLENHPNLFPILQRILGLN
jgi:hypothetical protein